MVNIDTMYQWIVGGCVYGYYHVPDGKLIGYVATPLQEQCSGDDKDDEEDKRTAMTSSQPTILAFQSAVNLTCGCRGRVETELAAD